MGDAGDGRGGQRVYRPPAWLRLLTNLPLLVGAGIIVQGGLSDGGGALVLAGVVAGLMSLFVVRSFQLCVAVGEDVRVVNWRGTTRYPWSDVAGFEFNRAGLWLTRRNGEQVAVKAFSFGRALKPVQRQGHAIAEELEAVRKAHRPPRPPGGPGRKKRRR